MPNHTPQSLPLAIKKLFELNSFSVEGPIKKSGAEIDLVATSKNDPFATPIYIEATVEYVDNTKYGKDVTKAILIQKKEPSARFAIISSTGFTLDVKERAKESGIETLTYDELFSKFEKFGPYLKTILDEGHLAEQLKKLYDRYEEPNLNDHLGTESATAFLSRWKDDLNENRKWLVIVGEYGTGKTALTQILTKRWLEEYKINPSKPIPLRLELRDFTRQFDARGLLHHFLDKNELGHIPVDFVISLIHTGRVVLILDGYDEMAQYLHARERRTCLEALASFSNGGGKGILTSRPNYFSEAEELQVVEALYTSIENLRFISKEFQAAISDEKAIDSLLDTQFVHRFERSLQDLTPEQTQSLIDRVLAESPKARAIVTKIIKQVFRGLESGDIKSLAGKPVIITYLLEIADDLRADKSLSTARAISEWDIYNIIVEKLMMRDFKRSPIIVPQKRLSFLQALAMTASKRQTKTLEENHFVTLIQKQFQQELRKREADKSEEIDRLFSDLRSSATLTRGHSGGRDGWIFSHNSLREFLCAKYLLGKLDETDFAFEPIPITDAMKTFVASLQKPIIEEALQKLNTKFRSGHHEHAGHILCLLWPASVQHFQEIPINAILSKVVDKHDFTGIALDRIQISSHERPASIPNANFTDATISDCDLTAADLSDCTFTNATLQAVSLQSARLTNATFRRAALIDVDITNADISGANIEGLTADSSVICDKRTYRGEDALGFMIFSGARGGNVPAIRIYQHHPNFEIAEKIARKLVEGGLRQERGLTQRGAARQDPNFARDFIGILEKNHWANSSIARPDLIEITDVGRKILGDLVERRSLDPILIELFK